MITPNLGADLAEEMADAASKAELTILRRLVDLLRIGIDNPAVDYQQVQLANVQKLRAMLVVQLRALNAAAAAEIQDALEKAYSVGSASALADLAAYVTATSAVTSPATSGALQALAAELTSKVESLGNTILRRVPDIYQQVVGRVVEQTTLGSITRKQAAQQALNQLLGSGILVSPEGGAGRMSLTDYVTMATRTGATNAAIAGHTQALLDNGLNLCMIQLGPRPCETCDIWADRILSVDGVAGTITTTDMTTGEPTEVEVDATLDEARDDGWGHPNCRCGLKAYIPGATQPSGERLAWDKEGYEAQQRQREIEREIRSYKTEEALALSAEAEAAAAAKVADWQQTMRDHMRENEFLKRQYDREQP